MTFEAKLKCNLSSIWQILTSLLTIHAWNRIEHKKSILGLLFNLYRVGINPAVLRFTISKLKTKTVRRVSEGMPKLYWVHAPSNSFLSTLPRKPQHSFASPRMDISIDQSASVSPFNGGTNRLWRVALQPAQKAPSCFFHGRYSSNGRWRRYLPFTLPLAPFTTFQQYNCGDPKAKASDQDWPCWGTDQINSWFANKSCEYCTTV